MQPPIKSNGKLLLVAQFWAADLVQMLSLLRLYADMEDGISQFCDIMLFPRRDTKVRSPSDFDFLGEKFYHVHRCRSKRPLTGWPHGPNAVAMDAFKYLHGEWKAGRFEHEAVLLGEADCVPLRRFWHKQILEEWRESGKAFLGHWDGSGSEIRAPRSHMNGNLVFHPSFFDIHPEMAYGEVPNAGWDMAFWPKIAPHAQPSRLIYSDYRLNTPKNPLRGCDHLWEPRFHTHPENPLVGQPLYPCYLHGIKGLQGIDCVRNKLGLTARKK